MLLIKKDPLVERDVFLAHIDEKPAFFGWITNITPDVKKGWWRIRFVVLATPTMTMTWTLDDNQIRGEGFTMGGIPVQIEKVVEPEEKPEPSIPTLPVEAEETDGQGGGAKIISLFNNSDD